RNYEKGPMKRKDIERIHGISRGYLENILSSLKEHNFVTTVRGAEGGFVLKRPPSQITLFDIVKALEGSIYPVDCVENTQMCQRWQHCASRTIWVRLYQAQYSTLHEITLQDCVAMEENNESATYEI
ncbi:MAG: Rrf2 family transcriptional regulator, partial [Chitinivibrionales bacterium]|nr:Rrf2 family transcriptional regulator [Chitinivibrionales bacterium]